VKSGIATFSAWEENKWYGSSEGASFTSRIVHVGAGVTKAAQARKLLAIVLESRCVECGICIGACPFEALELPRFLERDVQEKVVAACQA
jgi:ferredoxin